MLFTEEELQGLPPNIVVETFSQGSFPAVEAVLPDPQREYTVVRKRTASEVTLPVADPQNVTSSSSSRPVRLTEDEDGDLSGIHEESLSGIPEYSRSGPQLLNIEDARAVLNVYSMAHSSKVNHKDGHSDALWKLPLWVRCDGQDADKTFMMGCNIPTAQEDKRLTITSVTCDGPFEKQALPSMDSLRKSISTAADDSVSSKGYATYVIISVVSVHTGTDDDGLPASSITMEWEWPRVMDLLEPPHGLQGTLKVKKGKGEILHTTPERNIRELGLLKSLITALSTDEIYWPPMEDTPQSVTDIVTTYLQDLRDNPVNEKYVQTFEEEGRYEKDVFGNRLLDFTERIWLIIAHNATCYGDVTAALELVEDAFRNGHLQPMIHQDNTSMMANTIREFYFNTESPDQWQKFSFKNVSSEEMLISLALDKIRRDFTTYLIANSLCLGHQITWYIPPKDSTMGLKEQAQRLRCLHHVVELGLLTTGFLRPYITCNLDLMKSAILHYQTNPPDEEYTVVAPAIPGELRALCQQNRNIPSQWRVELKSRGPKEQTLIVSLSRNPLFSRVEKCQQFDSTANDLQEDETITYFLTKVRQHRVKLL